MAGMAGVAGMAIWAVPTAARNAAGAAAKAAAITAAAAAALAASPASAAAPALAVVPFAVVGDGILEPLTAHPGNAAHGRAIVTNRQQGLCLLCHSGPFPEERAQGNMASNLSGTGSRWTAAQLRLRVADARWLDPQGLMPSFHRVQGHTRVGSAWQGRPILDAQQVEDVVAFLQTLQ